MGPVWWAGEDAGSILPLRAVGRPKEGHRGDSSCQELFWLWWWFGDKLVLGHWDRVVAVWLSPCQGAGGEAARLCGALQGMGQHLETLLCLCRVDISDTLMYVYEMLGAELLSSLYDKLGRLLTNTEQPSTWQVSNGTWVSASLGSIRGGCSCHGTLRAKGCDGCKERDHLDMWALRDLLE